MRKELEGKAGVYLPGLNGLRFFAALLVVLGHIELFKEYHGYSNAYSHLAVYELGRMGVTFFFVLSGFLITYLLLKEKRATNTISVRKFYVRRVLRIWPLYFLMVILAFFVLPRTAFFNVPNLSPELPVYFKYTFLLFLLFLPQLALSIFPPVPYAEPLWSIGVEEQFYLLWPVLIKYFKRLFPLMISVVAAGFLIKQLAFVTASQSKDSTAIKYWNYFINFFYFTRIECMAVGAIGAWCVFKCQKGVLALAYHKVTQLAVYALLAYSLVTVSHKPVFNYTPYAILHCLVIINVATNPHSLLKLESGLFVFLGNISYSIYMFHEVAIQIAMNAIGRFHTTTFGDPASNVALYASSIIFSLALATVSYQFFELKFLRLKRTYSVILSGSDVKEEHARLVRR